VHRGIARGPGVCYPGWAAWPDDIYSLDHVALPLPPNDPLYGGDLAGKSPGIRLGNIALRGERGKLKVAASEMLRRR